jgi:hypothetical protein
MQVLDGVKYTESVLGPVDILVNNAGVLYYTLMKNVQTKEWQHMVDVNVKGTLHCVGAVLGGMVSRRQGHVVNISSDGGRKVNIWCYCLTQLVKKFPAFNGTPTNGSFPEPDEFSPPFLTLFLQDPFQYYPPIYDWIFHIVSSLQGF